MTQTAIARKLGLSRNTVAKALRSQAPPKYERARSQSSAWALTEPAVRTLLATYPAIPTTVLAERVGWSGGNSPMLRICFSSWCRVATRSPRSS